MSNTPIVPYSDATALCGTVHTSPQNRDACHFAVYQVQLMADKTIPHVGCMLTINSFGYAEPTTDKSKALGILDPFIQDVSKLKGGDLVWLVLFPGMIKSLSHFWEHPEFPPAPAEPSMAEFKGWSKPPIAELIEMGNKVGGTAIVKGEDVAAQVRAVFQTSKEKSQSISGDPTALEYLDSVAEDLGLSVKGLISKAEEYLRTGNYYVGGDEAEGYWINDKFWDAYIAYTGNQVEESQKGNFISCSC